MAKLDIRKICTTNVLKLADSGNPRTTISLLTGFDIDTKQAEIGPIRLRRVGNAIDHCLEQYRMSNKSVVFELAYLEREGVSSMYAEPMMIFQCSLIAIQLLVDAWVGMSLIHHFDRANKEVGKSGSTRYQVADSWHPTKEPTISVDAAFRENFFRAFEAQTSVLGPALRRFSKACTEIMEESIVDFVIVLDGLLGRGVKDEITHRVAARGAILLASKANERLNYYQALRYLYKVRSAIVHGEAEEVSKPKQIERDALLALGLKLDEKHSVRYYVADFARRAARRLLLYFLGHEPQLNPDWLLSLELGLTRQ